MAKQGAPTHGALIEMVAGTQGDDHDEAGAAFRQGPVEDFEAGGKGEGPAKRRTGELGNWQTAPVRKRGRADRPCEEKPSGDPRLPESRLDAFTHPGYDPRVAPMRCTLG